MKYRILKERINATCTFKKNPTMNTQDMQSELSTSEFKHFYKIIIIMASVKLRNNQEFKG
jgi:hypothetical protein